MRPLVSTGKEVDERPEVGGNDVYGSSIVVEFDGVAGSVAIVGRTSRSEEGAGEVSERGELQASQRLSNGSILMRLAMRGRRSGLTRGGEVRGGGRNWARRLAEGKRKGWSAWWVLRRCKRGSIGRAWRVKRESQWWEQGLHGGRTEAGLASIKPLPTTRGGEREMGGRTCGCDQVGGCCRLRTMAEWAAVGDPAEGLAADRSMEGDQGEVNGGAKEAENDGARSTMTIVTREKLRGTGSR